jgi:sporulation protein YlmC with PRC-barrel domain
MRLSDGNLRGKTVIGADGQAVGEVAALFLNSETWSVESLQVKLRREIADRLGASRSMFHAGEVEIPIGVVQSVADAVVLSIPVNDLRRILPGESEPAPAH